MVSNSEREPLLRSASQTRCSTVAEDQLAQLPHHVYREIIWNVDVPLSEEQLRSPEIVYSIIQPLETSLAETDDPSIVYVLLLNRLHFIRERDSALASSTLNETRAQLCELLAIRLLRHQAVGKGSNAGLLAMSRALVGGFQAFQGAGEDVLERIRQKEGYAGWLGTAGAGKTNALELAILGKARGFIKSQATQRVITAIWEGRVTYTASSFLDILPDRWKIQDTRLYNIKNAPILDHYRLRVPKYRAILELFTFLVLFFSFLSVVTNHRRRDPNLPVSALSSHELWFFVYALGYSLDKIASIMEHGWSVYSAGLTNGLDALCVPIFLLAFIFRIHSVLQNDAWASDQAFAILSCAATLMFPRLAFAAISNNVLILSLRAMLADFAWLMGIAVFCFLGFVFALNHLCDGDYSVSRIGEWLIFIWFGLDGTGIDLSGEFHPILGPILFISYAALSNTLLVSLLVAILSGTYAHIAADAAAEDMFRKAVMTFEGVKSGSLFDYIPPLNLVALCVMWPLSKVTSPRWFHKINVATTRVLSLPVLLLIALYERQTAPGAPIRKYLADTRSRLTGAMPTKWAQKLSLLEGAHWECEAVFEYSPSGDEKEDDEEEDDLPSSDSDDESATSESTARQGTNQRARASAIISPAPPISRVVSSSSSHSVPSPIPTPSRTPPRPTPPPRSLDPPSRRATAHPQLNSDRLPANASALSFGRPSRSPDRLDSALSTSAPNVRFESPLAKLFKDHEAVEGGGGMRRRMSIGTARPSMSGEAARESQLLEMVQSLTAAVARLESKLEGKGGKAS